MKKVLVIVPFPIGDEDLARPQAQMGAVDLGPGIEFLYRPVRVGSKNYSSQHDMALADAQDQGSMRFASTPDA